MGPIGLVEFRGGLTGSKAGVRHAGGEVKGLVHHGDPGGQYTSREYLSYLEEHGIRSSMGKVGNAYDNAVAERVNGILKLEYLLDRRFKDYASALKAVRQAMELYNTQRPHLSLGMKVPAEVYASGRLNKAA